MAADELKFDDELEYQLSEDEAASFDLVIENETVQSLVLLGVYKTN